MTQKRKLLAIVEQGGYPNFTLQYQRNGYDVTMVHSMRKAISSVKKIMPDVVVAEFNYQSDFRDRTSSLESLLAAIARFSYDVGDNNLQIARKKTVVIVFYDKEFSHQLEKLSAVFNDFHSLSYPIHVSALEELLCE